MEKRYFKEDVVIIYNPRVDIWEIYEKESGIFIGDSTTLIGLVNNFEWLN